MTFTLEHPRENIVRIARKIGYQILGNEKNNEFNLVRTFGGNFYPRFHLYVKQEPGSIIFNLHLDQKKPSYGVAHAHSGEYEGELVFVEAERIKSLIH